MQRILFPVLLLFYGNCLMAQTFRADSLLERIKRDPDHAFVHIQNVEKEYRQLTNETVVQHLDKLKTVILANLDPRSQIDAFRTLASLCWEKNMVVKSIELYDQSIALAIPIEEYHEAGISHFHLAHRLHAKGMLSEALTRAYKANEYLVLAGDKIRQARAVSLMATIAFAGNNYSLSAEEGERAIALFRVIQGSLLTHGDSIEMMSTLNTCGLSYTKLNNIDKAMACFAEAEKLSLKLHEAFWTGLINGNKSVVYAARGDLDLAISALMTDYNNSLKFNEWGSAAGASISLADIYIRKNDWSSARQFLESGHELMTRYGTPRGLNARYLKTFSNILAHEKKEGLAYRALLRHDEINDSLEAEKDAADLTGIKNRYDIQQKESQIELLETENTLRQQQITIRNTIVATSAVIIVLLFVLAFVIYRYYSVKRKDNLLLVERNNEIGAINEELRSYAEALAAQNLTIQKLNEDLEMRVQSRTHELQEANTELDMFLYRASHDIRRPITTLLGLGNLAGVMLRDPNAAQLFDKVTDTALHMDRMLHKLQMVYSLNQARGSGRQIAITQAIQNTLDKFSDEMTRIGMHYKMNVNEPVLYQGDESLFSIIFQNLVENSITFRKPEELEKPFLWVDIAQFDQDLMVRVRDNGIGIESDYIEKIFDLHFRGTTLSRGNGLGLYLVKKALDILNGRVEVVSEYGVGSNFIFFFPTHSHT